MELGAVKRLRAPQNTLPTARWPLRLPLGRRQWARPLSTRFGSAVQEEMLNRLEAAVDRFEAFCRGRDVFRVVTIALWW